MLDKTVELKLQATKAQYVIQDGIAYYERQNLIEKMKKTEVQHSP
jgi:hypothetical protein